MDVADESGSPVAAIARSEAPLWLGLMALLFANHWTATLQPNESIYLLGPLRVVDPTVLSHDWTVGGTTTDQLAVVFRLLVAPLFLVTDDARVVALLARPMLWLWALAGFRVLASAMGVSARAWAVGMALYLGTSSGLTAGEWIFGGAEQKVLSYGAVLFALAAMLRGRAVAAGAWIGLAMATHPLVGGWSAAALGLASLLDVRRLGVRRLAAAGCVAAVFAAPALFAAAGLLASASTAALSVTPDAAVAATMSPAEFMARIRLPHHVDPVRFLNPRTIIELPLVFGSLLWLVARTGPAESRRLRVGFVAALCAFFCAGLVARPLGLYAFLVLFPFRVADSLVPALFWLCVPTAFAQWRRAPDGASSQGGRRALAGVLIVALLFASVEIRQLVKRVRTTGASWLPAERAERARELEIMWAIRRELPEDAVLAAAPCESDLWLFGRRAVVAGYKNPPLLDRILEWGERMRALQGGDRLEPFSGPACRKMAARFETLPLGAFSDLRDRYGATHALIDAVRDDLGPYEVLRAGGRTVIDLSWIDGAPGAR